MDKQQTIEQLQEMRASLLSNDKDYTHLDALVDLINIMLELVKDKN